MKIDRQSLARYAALRLRAPGQATSVQQGDRRSPFLGRGLEFADYRAYDPGDDIRLIDWNVYLRLGTALVRQFNEERSLSVKICIDMSASMAFGRPPKSDHAGQLAAAISLVAVAHRDPVVVTSFGGASAPLQAKAVNTAGMSELIAMLERLEPSGQGNAYKQLAATLGHSHADRLFVVSDLLYEPPAREALLRLMAASSPQPILLHVLGSDELAPDLRDVATVVDAETGEEVSIRDAHDAGKQYARGLEQWLTELRGRCRTLGIRYVPAYTPQAISDLVERDLRQARVVEHAAGGTS